MILYWGTGKRMFIHDRNRHRRFALSSIVFQWHEVIKNNNLCISDGNFNFDSWFDADWCDLFDNFSRAVQINETFVNSHFISAPCLGTFTTRCFSGGNSQSFGWETYWSFNLQLLIFSTSDQFRANFFQALHISAGQSDSNAMNSSFLLLNLFFFKCRLKNKHFL